MATKRKYIRKQAAKPKPVPDAPADSCVNRTAPYEDEMQALNSINLNTFNVIEVDRRIALLARIVLEGALRDPMITRKDKADLALRAISTLEGSRARTELWIKEEKGPIPIDVEAYDVEVERATATIKELAARKAKRLRDKALKVIGENGETIADA